MLCICLIIIDLIIMQKRIRKDNQEIFERLDALETLNLINDKTIEFQD